MPEYVMCVVLATLSPLGRVTAPSCDTRQVSSDQRLDGVWTQMGMGPTWQPTADELPV